MPSQGGGGVGMSCGVGTVATVNDAMSLEAARIGDTVAALRIEPAGPYGPDGLAAAVTAL